MTCTRPRRRDQWPELTFLTLVAIAILLLMAAAALAQPRVWTTSAGVMYATAAPNGWVGFMGTGQMPPVPAHLNVIDLWQEGDLWLLTGTSTLVDMLRVQPGQTVAVRFAGDIETPRATYNRWTPADFNGDGLVNSADISAFLSAWIDSVGTQGWLTGEGDFDASLSVDSDDHAAFLVAWLDGVQ